MAGVLPLKMLGVLAVVLLACDLNEGRILSKCELKNQLEAAQFQVLPDNMTVEDLIARLVCRANISGFNTHFVKFVTKKHEDQDSPQTSFQVPHQGPSNGPPLSLPPSPGQSQHQAQDPPQRKPQDSPKGRPQDSPQGKPQGIPQGKPQDSPQGKPQDLPQGKPQNSPQGKPQDSPQGKPQGPPQGKPQDPPQGKPQDPPQGKPQGPPQAQNSVQSQSQGQPQGQNRRPPKDSNQKSRRSAPQETGQRHPAVWHQYGLFQLNDKSACDSGVVPTLNVCRMNCSALIDDDILDDIICLKTMLRSMNLASRGRLSGSTPVPPVLDSLLVKECQDVVSSRYFAECA